MADYLELEKAAKAVRRDVVSMCHGANASHIASNLSCVEVLVAIYLGKIARVDPKNPGALDRDYVIQSKGHASAALYATLAHAGFFDAQVLKTYHKNGSVLAGHPRRNCVPGVEVSTGSLGHGLGLGCGMALAAKNSRGGNRAFVILSDGELDEGSVWEAVLFAGAKKVSNLIAIVDYNKIQSFGTVEEVLPLEPIEEKFRAFGWEAKRADGNSIEKVCKALQSLLEVEGKPKVLVADTVKGKGVSFMENKLEWHYKSPSAAEHKLALEELV